ncbi:hypothetical protein CORC01_03833 [Colletotrichum orchidophilum]|uniref:Glycoside hydrolase 131 catalytic N-terminal domain-containing protein n=1 Tax=Colletotrichum orchidophilum TaxID=1209926 RepID=A0A1G4BI02_9PEZI|nr:uncharacterized protein CORC01_03833 [Colletotrichum orchidophilum]OHF01005.1 hypothetical protein CORC01_03833 [Colletotrichum orchidophilum]
MFASTLFLSLVAAALAACDNADKNHAGAVSPHAKAQCPLQFDGRIPKTFKVADFDTSASPFSSSNVLGKGLKFSEIIQLPGGTSLFDVNSTQPFEVTISDKSIFAPSATNVQTGFRRAEMLPASNDGKDASTDGIKTLHFSLQKDTKRLLNQSHEYQLVFLESADFSTNQLVLKTGTILGQNTADPDTLQLFGNLGSNPVPELFKTKFTSDVHNFAVRFDFTKKYYPPIPHFGTQSLVRTTNPDSSTTEVFYSKGNSPLKSTGGAVANNISGKGQFHFGLLKKPVNGGSDITKSGDQPSGINEGIIYSGIFEEDSSKGCISLSP